MRQQIPERVRLQAQHMADFEQQPHYISLKDHLWLISPEAVEDDGTPRVVLATVQPDKRRRA
jgi:hypothetical protein